MSWRSNKNDKYNRSEQQDECIYWMNYMAEEAYSDYEAPFWDLDGWWHYGWVENMDQYHQLKVLTLLRKFEIREALIRLKGNYWA